ncbi:MULTISPECIES: N-acetylmuramoyl-L-alanine amidase [Clostridium]|uniref:N-acetylmuramoyl-L-alanine amidase n=2 Tax=Clostridium TaxID=1485 RepID=A0AAU8YU97_CLOBO|nr:N-acetylmuramoyl-L-alanine amidase [Clostridium sporogenes]AJD31584.1 putative peptidoglycan binding domain protein [Clostridium botulinum Prevot_594]AVP63821.1 N-acetylmuramoyl-L-alanine amidase [Clostridium botulinum]EHN13282.1 N-acetylmuramoyl-L-alanine amidase [Clostridium sporogenes PA 3679]KRU37119.1 N-acetylmuramoyl-L-alanine amidase [Clostridium sporogenes]KYN79106.1 N-acetylmuramoyl-L-alanine amidase [Clostridium sporogenes]
MKIGIDCGHTLSGADYGAVGIKAESNLTREVGTRVISKLQALGHTVIKCYKDTCSSLQDSLSYRTNTANNNNVDLYVSIHFNAFNGSAYGTEVLTYGGNKFSEATSVLNNIVSLGYTNRGIKDGSNLYVIRNTKAKSMLIECCFCDNSGDMSKFNADKMADAIVKGLVGKTTDVPSGGNSGSGGTSSGSTIYGNHYLIRELQQEINSQGFGNIKVDGIAGDATLNVSPIVKKGARGGITKAIQKMLINIGYPVGSSGADGIFGNGTETAVKAIQKDCNLSVDGIIGRETWKALFRNLR